RRAVGEAVPAGDRRHVDDAASLRLLQMRDGQPRDVEHGGEVDGDDLVPVVRRVLIDRQRHTGNPCVVDEHVEAAEGRDRLRHHARDFGAAAHVVAAGDEAGDFLGEVGERFLVDVAGEDLGAVLGKRAHEFAADAGRTGGDQYTL